MVVPRVSVRFKTCKPTGPPCITPTGHQSRVPLTALAGKAGAGGRGLVTSWVTESLPPVQVHVNFPDLLTTELLANLCRDKILDACREQMPEYAGQVGLRVRHRACINLGIANRMRDVGPPLLPRVSASAAYKKWSSTRSSAEYVLLHRLDPWVATPFPLTRSDACGTWHPAQVDWERLIDFPHGSLRLMGSRCAHSVIAICAI